MRGGHPGDILPEVDTLGAPLNGALRIGEVHRNAQA